MTNDLTVTPTDLDGVMVLEPRQYGDPDRGPFFESWNRGKMAEHGLDHDFTQDNQSLSVPVHTLRGLHFQVPPEDQAKLVRCIVGEIFDVAVDLRATSPTYGHWIGETLSPENRKQLLVPEGFAHGFVTLKPDTIVAYKCTGRYAPGAEGALRWDSCGIDWPFDGQPVLKASDAEAEGLADFATPFDADWSAR